MRRPPKHTLYWVYVYFVDGGYDFDTTARRAEALKLFNGFRRGTPPAKEVFIFYGDAAGAFTNIDPVRSFYAERAA